MQTTGSCLCGAVAYQAEVDERRIVICHCRDCQVLGGSAFRVIAVVAPGSFELTKGRPRTFRKTAESGGVRHLLFCAECGGHVAAMPPDPDEAGAFISLRIATSKDFSRLKPVAEIWCRSKVAWMPELPGTVTLDRQP